MTGTVVVTAVGGAQQGAVAAAFAAQGWTVRGTGRTARSDLPVPVQAADMLTAAGLDRAFDGADAVAFTLPQNHRPGAMTTMTRNVVAAAARAGVARLVVSLAGMARPGPEGSLGGELAAVRQAVRAGSAPFALLEPTIYMDNLRAPWSLPAIVGQGVFAYPLPEHARVAWLSHSSLAEFFVGAATRPEAAGGEFRIGGPEPLTGPEMAAILAERVGRPVAFQRVPIDAFAAGLNQAFGPPAGDRIAEIYRDVEADPDALAIEAEEARVLQVRPESFRAFVARSDWSPTQA